MRLRSAALVAAALAACTSPEATGSAGPPTDQASANAVAPVAPVDASTRPHVAPADATTVRFTLTGEARPDYPEMTLRRTATGASDRAARRSSLEVVQTGGGADRVMRSVTTAEADFVAVVAADGTVTGWQRLGRDPGGRAFTPTLLDPSEGDPWSVHARVAAAGDGPVEHGTVTMNGVPVQHLRYTIRVNDPREVELLAPHPDTPAGRAPPGLALVDVWVDDDDVVHRLRIDVASLSVEGIRRHRSDVRYFDFGRPLTIELPDPALVTDLDGR